MLPLAVSVIDNADPPTVIDSLVPLAAQFSMDIIDCYDFYGEFIASAGSTKSVANRKKVQTLVEAALKGTNQEAMIVVDDQLIEVITIPVGDPSDPSGVLLAGKTFDDSLANMIAEASNVSTIIEVSDSVFGKSYTSFDISNPDPHFRYEKYSIAELGGNRQANMFLVLSLEESEKALK